MWHYQACGTGTTVTDSLIVAAMLFYCPEREGSWAYCYSSGHPQFARRRNAKMGPSCNDALVKIVGLTVETNILTACVLSFQLFRPSGELSGTCGIISMLTVIIFPVCDFVCILFCCWLGWSGPLATHWQNRTSSIIPARKSHFNSVSSVYSNLIIDTKYCYLEETVSFVHGSHDSW